MLGSRSGRLAGTTLAGVALLLALGVSQLSARPVGGIPGTTTCKPFVGTKWVNPYPPHEVGHHYQITIDGTGFTCKSAAVYVKKFIAEKIKSTAKIGLPEGTVTGGPPGYVCMSGISYKTDTAYQGHCTAKKATVTSSSFVWGPYNDS